MDMEWTKDLSIPLRYKEDIFNGTRRTVYLHKLGLETYVNYAIQERWNTQ